MNDVMVDNETLAVTADAVIISIGAVKFDIETDRIDPEGFYRSISIESNLVFHRRISEDTLMWWMKQAPAAQAVFHEAKSSLEDVLVEFKDWLGPKRNAMWSNGADFDLPMLAHAYSQIGVALPWAFWDNRCFRSLKNLPGAKDIRLPAPGVKHNALSDALQQAQSAQLIYKTLFGSAAVKAKAKTK